MSEEDAKSDQLSLDVLVRGAEKTFDNAQHLFSEASVLAKTGAVARALCLHQISLEECSKVNNLGAWGVSLVIGLEVNQKKVLAALARHSYKNKSNAYMLERSDAENDAILQGNLKGAVDAFKKKQNEFHQSSNHAKNASLYVDLVDGEFVAPNERISEEMLAEIAKRNAKYLDDAHNHVKTLKQLAASPEEVKGLFSRFVDEAEKLRKAEPENPIKAIDRLILSVFDTE